MRTFRFGLLAAVLLLMFAGGARGQIIKNVTKSTSGLLLREDFTGSQASWTNSGQFVVTTTPTFVCFGGTPGYAIQPGTSTSDSGGIREAQINILSPTLWYMHYGAGDGTSGAGGPWRVQRAKSIDRGKTWTRQGAVSYGLAKQMPGDGNGNWAARDHVFTLQNGPTFYQFPLSATNAGGYNSAVDYQPYGTDVYSSSSFEGTWVFLNRAITPNQSGTGIDTTDGYFSSEFFDPYTQSWQTWAGETASGAYTISRYSAPTISGPWTFVEGPLTMPSGQKPENPKAFYSSALSAYCVLSNMVENSGSSKHNTLLVSPDAHNWTTGTTFYQTQHLSPSEDSTTSVSVGVISPLYLDKGIPTFGPSGELPVTFDVGGGYGGDTDQGRLVKYGVYEPAIKSLHYATASIATLFSDNFNSGTNNASLGNGWTIASTAGGGATYTTGGTGGSIQLNMGTSIGATLVYRSDVSVLDCALSATLTLGPACDVGFVFDGANFGTASETLYHANFDIGNGGQLTLYKKVSGTETQVGSNVTGIGITAGTSFTGLVSKSSGVFTFKVNGTTVGTITDTTGSGSGPAITAAGYVGLRNGDVGTSTRNVDNYVVTTTTTTDTLHTYYRATTNADFNTEFECDFTTINSGGYLAYDFRQDGSGNGYRLKIAGNGSLSLLKTGAGAGTIGTTSGSLTTGTSFMHRIWLTASGATLKAYLDGELQATSTADSTYSTGTTLGFAAIGVDTHIRLFSLRTGDTITVAGTSNGDVVTLRGAGGIPLLSKTSAGSNVTFGATDGLLHGPAVSLDVNGADIYIASASIFTSYIWGGDTLSISSAIAPSVAQTLICPNPTAGIAPYTYQWYQPATSGAAIGASNILSGQASQSLQVTPPGSGNNYYVCVVTDLVGNVVNSAQFTLSSSGTNIIKRRVQ